MKKWVAVVVVMLMMIPFTVQAGYKEGEQEFQISGSGTSDKDFDGTVFSTELSYSYFVIDNLGVFIRQGIGVADTAGGSDWNGSTRVGADYYFDIDQWQPYAGLSIGYLYGDNTQESFIAGPELGVKYFVNDTTFINLGAEYQFVFEDADESENAIDDGRWTYVVGVGFKF